jgi:hypothetical protein
MPEEIGDDGIQLTSTSLVVDRVILADQVLEARSLDGHIRIARKARQHASGDHARVLSGSTPSGPMTTSRSSRMWQMSPCDRVTPRASHKSAAHTKKFRRRRCEGLRQVTIEIGRFCDREARTERLSRGRTRRTTPGMSSLPSGSQALAMPSA